MRKIIISWRFQTKVTQGNSSFADQVSVSRSIQADGVHRVHPRLQYLQNVREAAQQTASRQTKGFYVSTRSPLFYLLRIHFIRMSLITRKVRVTLNREKNESSLNWSGTRVRSRAFASVHSDLSLTFLSPDDLSTRDEAEQVSAFVHTSRIRARITKRESVFTLSSHYIRALFIRSEWDSDPLIRERHVYAYGKTVNPRPFDSCGSMRHRGLIVLSLSITAMARTSLLHPSHRFLLLYARSGIISCRSQMYRRTSK
jgi:hypothetical protein